MVLLVILLLLLLLWLILPCGKRKRGDFFGLSKYDYAHRGLHGDGVPENSLAAFRRAVEQGGASVEGEKVTDIKKTFTAKELAGGLLVRRGKKNYRKVILK